MQSVQNKKLKRLSHAVGFILSNGLLITGLAFSSAAQANISFTFDYGADNGTGFWDATQGSFRQQVMTDASTAFGNMFGTLFSNSATILLSATATDLPLSTNLASAGSELDFNGIAGFTVREVVKTKALGGADLNGAAADGSVNVNFGQPWNLTAGATDNTKYDFYSTIFHEFTHALGFASLINQDGTGLGTNEWGKYDQFLVDKNGNRIINASTFEINQSVWDAASVGSTGTPQDPSHVAGIYFDGANAKAANGGNAVELYSPNPWEDGSSVSHIDDQSSALYGMMMTAQGPTGPWPRTYSGVEVGILQDLGYSRVATAAVPEPGTYELMLVGLGFMVPFARRRRNS